ncbi:DUF2058 domain-containing protein [Aquisalimonas asiatica]|uniref:Nucleoprotein/polynucleotide-associated enzyme n=1 Tax=Aquisalimonas asiatica TaxID=406100 RepID=A0A1H8U2A4_9GAMM|nr:DUF2058 domain-containing protein [Aquisalimonas asiatica]SEO97196.1 hypothetical protein SAMN04488052_105116 [Aquisalimonas asiatica]
MSNSLRDQLMKSGLVDEKQARQADKEKRAQRKKAKGKGGRKGQPADPDAAARQAQVQQARAEKAERDRTLNQQREQQKKEKSAAAQIEDLLREHAISTRDGSIPFHFTRDGKVRKLEVTAEQQKRLSRGELAIVERKGRFHVVPSDVVPRLHERDATLFVAMVTAADLSSEDDDLYREFPIPDDLDW